MKSRMPGSAVSQDIAGEVVEDVACVARELDDEAPRILLLLEDDRGQTESREPTFGPLGELLYFAGCEPNVGLSKERVGFRGGDAEVSGSELRQVAMGAEPGNRQAGIVAARDDDLDRGRGHDPRTRRRSRRRHGSPRRASPRARGRPEGSPRALRREAEDPSRRSLSALRRTPRVSAGRHGRGLPVAPRSHGPTASLGRSPSRRARPTRRPYDRRLLPPTGREAWSFRNRQERRRA